MKATQAKIQGVLVQPGGTALPAQPIKGGGTDDLAGQRAADLAVLRARSWESCHPGIDIGVPTGTPIRAALGGRSRSPARPAATATTPASSTPRRCPPATRHQSSIGVSVGPERQQGQVIGPSAAPGCAIGAHLHFEVRINGAVTNPMNYL